MDVLRWTEGHFKEHGLGTPRLDAELIVAHALGLRRIDLYMRTDQPLNEAERTTIRELIPKRLSGEPVAYITGHKEFWGMQFKVTHDVLIPRPETEELVEQAHVLLLDKKNEPLKFLDLGTGSGCIAAALAKEFPSAELMATDISGAALDVARNNLESLGFADRINILEGDLYEPLGENERSFDLIISNPPYIPSKYLESLAPEVKSEPQSAYDGGTDGLDFTRPIVEGAATRLKPGGFLIIEIHETHENSVGAITPNSLEFRSVRKDIAGFPRLAWWQKTITE